MTVIAPKISRGPGTLTLQRPVPNGVVAGTEYRFTALMDAADIADASLMLTLSLSLDNRVVWGPNDWTCNVVDRRGNPVAPNFSYSCPESPPSTFTITVNLPRAVNIGCDVTTVNPSVH